GHHDDGVLPADALVLLPRREAHRDAMRVASLLVVHDAERGRSLEQAREEVAVGEGRLLVGGRRGFPLAECARLLEQPVQLRVEVGRDGLELVRRRGAGDLQIDALRVEALDDAGRRPRRRAEAAAERRRRDQDEDQPRSHWKNSTTKTRSAAPPGSAIAGSDPASQKPTTRRKNPSLPIAAMAMKSR